MTAIQNQKLLENIKSGALVYDLETSSHYADGTPIPIGDFDNYVANAIVKWFGCYSYKYKKAYSLNAITDRDKIIKLLADHDVLVGFNSEEFDYPILENNGFIREKKRYIQVDVMQVLGTSTFSNRKGFSYKNRGLLMGFKFKNNRLKTIAEAMGLKTQKGDIDYAIFHKNEWLEEETEEIITYLYADVMATKEMFDALWVYWMPFTQMIDIKNIKDLSWIKNSIASLTYKSACYYMGEEPTYGEKGSAKEDMGGLVLLPKREEATKVWYIDFSSLYPHIFCILNLFNETNQNNKNAWHGNDVFKVKGYYDISEEHTLTKIVKERLKERIDLKENDPTNPMIYTLKIWLNALYGIVRSAIFEKVHTENAGYDCCWFGQQLGELVQEMMLSFGFNTIQYDTDGAMVVAIDEKNNNREYVIDCLNQIIEIINDNVPFPVDTFKIDIEEYIEYLMCPFSEEPAVDEDTRKLLNKKDAIVEGYETVVVDKKKVITEISTGNIVRKGRSWVKKRTGNKKNYFYLYKDGEELKYKIMGLPIKKANATLLAMKIFKEVLEQKILDSVCAKFPKKFIDDTLAEYLKRPDTMELLSREFKIKPLNSYKSESCIHAQISKGYFNGGDGVIRLIKNNKIGNAGKGFKYCKIQEAIDAKLTIDDIDLEKVRNELRPFIKYEKEN